EGTPGGERPDQRLDHGDEDRAEGQREQDPPPPAHPRQARHRRVQAAPADPGEHQACARRMGEDPGLVELSQIHVHLPTGPLEAPAARASRGQRLESRSGSAEIRPTAKLTHRATSEGRIASRTTETTTRRGTSPTT